VSSSRGRRRRSGSRSSRSRSRRPASTRSTTRAWRSRYDERLLAELPPAVDPCGENGEFHTFVHAGPIFAKSIAVEAAESVERDGFVFCDLRPV
jgi:diphthamide synthase (EF-2-diphthine--ammonia ligase)